MKKNNYWRFILNNSEIPERTKEGAPFELNNTEKEIFRQVTKVFRCKIGDILILMNQNFSKWKNREFHFEIVSIGKHDLQLILRKTIEITDPIEVDLGLVLGLPNRPSKLEEILMHCTELGVTEFTLLTSDNSHYSHKLRQERLDKIVKEATEQSERARIPKISIIKNIDEYLENKKCDCYVGMERGKNLSFFLGILPNTSGDILIGPEGGFSEREINLFKDNKLKEFSLGKAILRTETAAILATGIASLSIQSESTS